MTKDDIRNIPIGTPVLLKVWFADASDKYAIVEFKDENGNIKECRVAHSAIVKPKPEWFKPKQNNESS